MKCRFFVTAVGLVLATALFASAAPLVTGGLAFYYSFDDVDFGDDVIVNDGSGNDMNGKVVTAASDGQTSAITFVPGVYGNAASFAVSAADDAANDDYACIEIVNTWDTAGEPAPLGPDGDPADGALSYAFQNDGDEPNPADIPTSAMTLALWANCPSAKGSQATFCASAYDPDRGTSGGLGNVRAAWPYHLEIKDTTFRYTIRYDGGDGAGMETIVSHNPVPNAAPVYGEWMHLAWVYDASEWAFYMNGEKVASGAPDAAQPIYDNWDNGALLGMNPDVARQFFGEMDEVYMFKRALSASEIATLAVMPGLQGDLNGDGWVNSGDLDLVRGAWGTSDAAGDANGDGTVNSSDLDIIRANWGAHSAAAAVPEPTTFVLLGAMSLLACLIRRR